MCPQKDLNLKTSRRHLHFAALSFAFLFAVFFANAVIAAHAPYSYYIVPNSGIYTDRFSTPEEAGRVTIARFNAANGSANVYYTYDHIESGTGTGWPNFTYTYWRIYYRLTNTYA